MSTMQSLEAACEEGECATKKFKSNRNSLPLSCLQDKATKPVESSAKSNFCLHTKLLEIHNEESKKNPSNLVTGFKHNSLLLEKLVARERLNCLVVNLHPGLTGYSLMVPVSSCSGTTADNTTANMIKLEPFFYEDDRFLDYINNEELPGFIVDLLKQKHSFLFYNGCIIAEIRDYRQTHLEAKCDIHHVLLRPSYQSILSEVNNAPKDWSQEEKLRLESQLLLERTPHLCLTTDNTLSEKLVRLQHTRHIFNTHKLRRMARKFSQVAIYKRKRLSQSLRIRKPQEELKPVPVPNLDSPLLCPPAREINIAQFKAYQRPKETSDCLPQLMKEYVIETDIPLKEEGKKRLYHIKLSILQRPHNSEYLGELYLEWDHKENKQNGVACRFSLGSEAHANKYIQQFTDIFTEYGRKRVKITSGVGSKTSGAQSQTATTSTQQAPTSSTNFMQQTAQMVNGTITPGVNVLQQNQHQQLQNASSVLSQLHASIQQSKIAHHNRSEELEINALAAELKNSVHQFEAESAKQQQKQKLASILSSATCSLTDDTSASIINSSTILPQKRIARKLSLANNARIIDHNNLISINNRNLSDYNQPNAAYLQKQQRDDKSAISALLVGVAAADRPEGATPSANSVLLERIPSTPNFVQNSMKSGGVLSPKMSPVISPMSSPPPQNTINMQGLTLQNLSGMQNVQVQLASLPQPISLSLNVSSTGTLQGHPAGLIVSLPVTTATATSSSATQQVSSNTVPVGATPTVFLANTGSSNFAQLVTTGVKGLGQQGLRAAVASGVTLQQGAQPFHTLLTQVQRPRFQQANVRGIQRSTPITFKMATAPNSTGQKQQTQQQQQQQFQQLYTLARQQKSMNIAGKVRRRSSAAEPQ